MIIAAIIWWVLALGGLIPTSWFLWRFRPKWPVRAPSAIVNGLVAVIWLGYVRSVLVVLLTRHGVPTFKGFGDLAIAVFFGVLIDWLLILLLVTFLRYRKQWQDEKNGGTS